MKFLGLHNRCCQTYCRILDDFTGLIHEVFMDYNDYNSHRHTHTHRVRIDMCTGRDNVESVSFQRRTTFEKLLIAARNQLNISQFDPMPLLRQTVTPFVVLFVFICIMTDIKLVSSDQVL